MWIYSFRIIFGTLFAVFFIETIKNKNMETFRITSRVELPAYNRTPDDIREQIESVNQRNKNVLDLFNSTDHEVILVDPNIDEDEITTHVNLFPTYRVKYDGGEANINVKFGDTYVVVADSDFEATVRTQIAYDKELKLDKYKQKLETIFSNLVKEYKKDKVERDFRKLISDLPKVDIGIDGFRLFLKGVDGDKVIVEYKKDGETTFMPVFKFTVTNEYASVNLVLCEVNTILKDITEYHTTYLDLTEKLDRATFLKENYARIFAVVATKAVEMLTENKVFG